MLDHQNQRSNAVTRIICSKAKQYSEEYLSQFQLPSPSEKLPVLDLGDINRGKVLGKGGFGTVYAVKSIDSSTDDTDSMDSFNAEKDVKYAIKVLNPKAMISDDDLFNTLMDNATEAKLLGSLNHPNIIKIRAIPASGMFSEHSFLLLDRLEGTLRERIREWKPNASGVNQVKGILSKVLKRDANGHKEAAFWDMRIQYAMDLTSALAYMHSHRVVHRDLKPENIGFDRDNNIRIFDFGLARQLPEPVTNDETLFKLTCQCGSPRYMAPEVALHHPYNEKVDVYSFALLLWEILSLETPFMGVNKNYLKVEVWRGRRVRPKMNSSWSPNLRNLLQDAWNHDEMERPSMVEIGQRLHRECHKVETHSSKNTRKAWFKKQEGVASHCGGIQDATLQKNTPTSRAA
eukprot:Nitzschia sp. Nitz4//scaffold293_size23253//12624//13941//NITZ4_008506-RA/size23253-augustus-gene-0.4-mRNA-1//1//CDS//3329546198//8965//frame0